MKYMYDIIVIGGGAGGLTAAKTAKGFGKRVAIVEKNKLGGECTWTGCVPSKALIKTAEVMYHATHMQKFGLASTACTIDTSHVMDHARAVVQEVYSTHTPEKITELGIDVLLGGPEFIDPHTIFLNDKNITAKQFVITTGSSPFIPPINGLQSIPYLTNQSLFALKTLPQSLIILGGGPIGVEMASALNRLGVAITIIEMNERIMLHEDRQVVQKLSDIMKQEGVTIATGMKATKAEQKEDEIVVTCTDSQNNQKVFSAEKILIATGRKPNIEDLGLEKIGVTTTRKGIVVDDTMRTSVKNIYAAGDVVGPYQFSHMAWHQAVAAVRNASIPFFKKKMRYNDIIWVTFTAPELAHAGLTETQAREKYGDSIKIYYKHYDEFDRGQTDRTQQGFAKIICDRKGYILGAHILGERAGDIIHELQLAKAKKIPLYALQSIIHAYPTYAELNWHIAKQAYLDHLNQNMLIRIMKRLMKK